MEVAIRAINWLWAFFLFAEAPAFDEGRQGRLLAALGEHAGFMLRHREIGARPGNRYLTDGLGLLALGAVLREVHDSQTWLGEGRRIVWGEALRQVTPDGVDYEHAIGYHGYVLHCLLFATSLEQRNGVEPPAAALERIQPMLEIPLAYTRPDRTVPAIGDRESGV